MKFEFEPIAWVKECSYKEKFGTPRQGSLNPESKAFIQWTSTLPAGSIEGLEGFSYIWLLWVFHENTNTKVKGKVFAPRLGGGSMGVLASRSPHRPNPIGLSRVKLEEIETKGLWVSGIDLVEGTPILDVKPFIREDQLSPEDYEQAKLGWPTEVPPDPRLTLWQVNLSEELPYLNADSLEAFKSLVEKTLSLDPRPVVYKKLEQEQDYSGPYGLSLGFEGRRYNLKFRSDNEAFEIVQIEEQY